MWYAPEFLFEGLGIICDNPMLHSGDARGFLGFAANISLYVCSRENNWSFSSGNRLSPHLTSWVNCSVIAAKSCGRITSSEVTDLPTCLQEVIEMVCSLMFNKVILNTLLRSGITRQRVPYTPETPPITTGSKSAVWSEEDFLHFTNMTRSLRPEIDTLWCRRTFSGLSIV